MEQLVARQFHLWEHSRVQNAVTGRENIVPSITISKEIGSQGEEFAQALSQRLGWKIFDRELVEYIAQNAHVRQNMVEMFDEKTQNEIHNWVFTLLDSHALGSDKYFKHLVTAITTIGEEGGAIILGRGANFILSCQRALKVKVTAPLQHRIGIIMQKFEVSEKEAFARVHLTDKERQAFLHRFFHHDSEEISSYDLVLNLGTLSLSDAENIVIQALKQKFSQFKDWQ
jgi:cytidylate kinase